jgi:Uncharacterized alpha/beta hydrolase domain (DUF2235)
LSRRHYQFYNTRLGEFVDYAFHAVAIDELGAEFAPTLWTGVPIPIEGHETKIEKRWFVGAHSNVGGGGQAQQGAAGPLSTLAREWIVDRAIQAGLVLRSQRPRAGFALEPQWDE